MARLPLIIAIVLSITTLGLCQKPDHIIELCRHGARGPSSNMFDPSWPKWYLEQLTPKGMRQHYVLGKAIREKYPHLFDNPSPDFVNVMSDGGNRTTLSAMSQQYGIFLESGPGFDKDYQSDRALPPFYDNDTILPILHNLSNDAALPYRYYPMSHTEVQGDDSHVIHPVYNCPNWKVWEGLAAVSGDAFYTWGNFTDLVNNMEKYDLVLPMNNPLAMVGFADTMESNYVQGKEFPGGVPTDKDLITNLTFATSYYATLFQYGSPIKTKVAGTPTIRRLLQVLDEAFAGKMKAKYTLYSGHDNGLLALLNVLNVTTPSCILENFQYYWENNQQYKYLYCQYPEYAANIIFEVYTSTKQVRFLYNDIPVPLCNGEAMCNYQDFVDFALKQIDNWTLETAQSVCHGAPPPSEQTLSQQYIELFAKKMIVVKNSISSQTIILALTSILCIVLGAQVYRLQRKNRKLEQSIQEEKLIY